MSLFNSVAPLPPNEAERLRTLDETGLEGTPPEPEFDEMVQLAAAICGTPMCCVSLVGSTQLWRKARVGLEDQTDRRDSSFCSYAILEVGVFVVPDAAADARFVHHPLVMQENGVRFYAGVPLTTQDGHNVGVLCVFDAVPRNLSPQQEGGLKMLAQHVVSAIELRRHNRLLQAQIAERVTREKALEEKNTRLLALSSTDALTGLRNRRAFDEALIQETSRAGRYGTELSLILLDIDNFKTINDNFGHAEGDLALCAFAKSLTSRLRSSDLPARFGGEEFTILLPNTGRSDAMILAERLRAGIEEDLRHPWRATASLGVAQYEPIQSAEQLLAEADRALYDAKRLGKNRVAEALT